jgi:hypothetical protein
MFISLKNLNLSHYTKFVHNLLIQAFRGPGYKQKRQQEFTDIFLGFSHDNKIQFMIARKNMLYILEIFLRSKNVISVKQIKICHHFFRFYFR